MKAALRVLHVVAGNLFGGVESILLVLARQPRGEGRLEPAFAVCFSGRLREELEALHAAPVVLGAARASRPWQIWRARRELRRLLARERFDAVICHMPWSLAVFGPAVRRMGLPLVFWMHDVVGGTHWIERWARRSPPDLAVINSRFTAESLPHLFPKVPVSVIVHGPVSPPDKGDNTTAEIRQTEREKRGVPPDCAVIVQVGRMEAYKGHQLHLQALTRLRGLPGWTAWIVGGAQRPHEQKYQAQLEDFVSQNGLANRVHFLGERSDVPRLLAAADIFCQPNARGEPFGLVFAEALYAGLPVVTTAIGGALEIVDETCGRLTPPDDPQALAEKLRELIASPDLRIRLGKNGPARAAAISHPDTTLGKLEAALREVSGIAA